MAETPDIPVLIDRAGGRILDLRPAQAFAAGHLAGAVSHPLPGPITPAELDEHLPSIFLPPREDTLLVVAGRMSDAETAVTHLAGRGRAPIWGLGLDSDSPPDLPTGLWVAGPSVGHLWAPPSWLAAHADLLPPPAAGPVLDLACGSGRAAVWLAARGYRVTGLDWQAEALALGRRLAASCGVSCDFRTADLRRTEAVPVGPWAIVLNFRFLERALLAVLPRIVAPAGVAMVRTFRDAPGYDGHPRPRYRLGRGELIRAFARGQWEVLAHDEGFDPDRRPAAGIVARRRADRIT